MALPYQIRRCNGVIFPKWISLQKIYVFAAIRQVARGIIFDDTRVLNNFYSERPYPLVLI
jgi:hypothetical protein